MAVRRNFMIWSNLIEPTTSCLCERDQCRRHRSGVYQHKSEPCSRCLGALTYNHCAGNICIWCWVIATDPSQEAGPAVGPPYCFPSFTPMMRKAETRYLLVKMLWRITAHSRVMSITKQACKQTSNLSRLYTWQHVDVDYTKSLKEKHYNMYRKTRAGIYAWSSYDARVVGIGTAGWTALCLRFGCDEIEAGRHAGGQRFAYVHVWAHKFCATSLHAIKLKWMHLSMFPYLQRGTKHSSTAGVIFVHTRDGWSSKLHP
jgi:hypothetical protein